MADLEPRAELTAALKELADILVSEEDVDSTINRITRLAVACIDGPTSAEFLWSPRGRR